jgi:hypothetical protein
VRRLSEGDASAMLTFVSELKELVDPLAFPPFVLARLQALITSDWVGYSELDPVRQRSILQVARNADGDEEIVWGDEGSSEDELWWRLRSTHPLCGYRTASGDWTTARKVSDFAPLHEFRRTPIFDAFYRGLLDHWLDVGLAATPTKTRVFIFTRRDGRDFDERDRLVAELLQPHLAARAETAEAALRAADALATVEISSNDDAHHVVLCSRTGVIEFASPSSRALLETYLGITRGRVPAAALEGPTLTLSNVDRRLHVRIADTGQLKV